MSDEERIQSKINYLLPKIDDTLIEAIHTFRENGFNPKIIIIPSNTLIPEGINQFYGVFIEHRLLRKPNGDIVEILFEE